MSDNWVFQLSAKIDGQHLVNVRAEDAVTFKDLLAWTKEHADDIREAALALQGAQKAAAAPPAPAPPPQQQARPQAPAGEIGPVTITGVGSDTMKRDGTVMTKPKYTVNFSNGKKHSTFDAVVGDAAMSLQGQSVYYTIKVNGEYQNLASLRSAS